MGWFQILFQKTAMPYNYVGKGEHVNLFMNIHMAKCLPIEGIYKYTASDEIKDCENDPDYDRDKVVAKIVHQKFYLAVLSLLGWDISKQVLCYVH